MRHSPTSLQISGSRAEQILQNADYQNEILQIIGQQRDLHLQEIQADQMKKYAACYFGCGG